jgi:hypothetical protein
MAGEISICDFIHKGCKSAEESETFLNNWLSLYKNPCTICSSEQSKCNIHDTLVDMRIIDEKGNPLLG